MIDWLIHKHSITNHHPICCWCYCIVCFLYFPLYCLIVLFGRLAFSYIGSVILHGTPGAGVSQTLRRSTEGAIYSRRGGHHVGYRPTFYLLLLCTQFMLNKDYQNPLPSITNANVCHDNQPASLLTSSVKYAAKLKQRHTATMKSHMTKQVTRWLIKTVIR